MIAAAGVGLLLLGFVRVDPPTGVTASASPFTDEAWHVVNARNLVLLGRWSTDDYNLQLITAPFSLAVAAAFGVLGIGIVQARIVAILATGLTVAVIAIGLRTIVGRGPALVAALAFGTSTLVLYYGRLAFLEPVETLFLVMVLLLAVRGDPDRRFGLGVLAGIALALAIGTKASAIVSGGGILAGALIMAIRDPCERRWLVGCVTGLGLCGLGWLIVVGLPNLGQLPAVLSTLPPEPLPASPGDLLKRVAGYLVHSDGAWPLAAPLLVGAMIAAAVGVAHWSRLSTSERRLMVLSICWLVTGFGILFLVAYRPNRYVVPLLPALAAIVGLGSAVIARTGIPRRAPRRARTLVLALVLGALVAPGLLLDVHWMTVTPSTMQSDQAHIAVVLPAGAVVQGAYSPLLAMTARATTLIVWAGGKVNAGDLYTSRGVRWVVAAPGQSGDTPSWVDLHPAAWAARRAVACVAWGGAQVCLFALPGS